MLDNKITDFIHKYLKWDIKKLTLIEKLGGLSNSNYKVIYENNTYFIRLCNENTYFQINRSTEIEIIEKSNEIHLCSEPIFFDTSTGNMVMKFIEGTLPTEEESNSYSVIKLLAHKIQEFHKLKCNNIFNPFSEIERRLKVCKEHKLPLPDYIHLLENHILSLQEDLSHFPHMGLCHNDLNPSNIIIHKHNLFLIDYEFSSMGDIFLDLATISWLITDENRKLLLEEYFGYFDENHYVKLIKYLFIVKMLNATWSLIKSLDTPSTSYDFKFASTLIFQELFEEIRPTLNN